MTADLSVVIDADIFNEAYIDYLDADNRTQILFGGSSSGKSVFLAQRAAIDLLAGGRNYLVCRAVGRTIKNSVFNEIKKVIYDWGLQSEFTINKSDLVITCSNGYQIIFVGLDDVEKVKSITPVKGVITDIWIEEATEIEQDTLKQLYKRQRGGSNKIKKRLILSFNPIYQTHWIYEQYFKPIAWEDEQKIYYDDDLLILKTTYKDNRFLTSSDIKDLENETDKYYYDVYTLGKWGVLGNVIFTNWKVMDLSNMRNEFTNRHHGLDFGFADDPAALSATHYQTKTKTIFIYDEMYAYDLTNPELAESIRPIVERDLVICDSEEPKSIRELKEHKINATGAIKGKDSVNFGIQWLRQQNIIIDKNCINIRNELQSYKWKEDKNGKALPVPVDRNNHGIDALRYAYESESRPAKERKAKTTQWI